MIIGGDVSLRQNEPTAVPRPDHVLNMAADVVESRGWHQGDFHDESSGHVCAAGAIRIAAGGMPFESCRDASPAEATFADCLTAHGFAGPGHCPVEVIGIWNDAEHRTAKEVIATLRAAAGEARSWAGAEGV
jgi:hypothetical protein